MINKIWESTLNLWKNWPANDAKWVINPIQTQLTKTVKTPFQEKIDKYIAFTKKIMGWVLGTDIDSENKLEDYLNEVLEFVKLSKYLYSYDNVDKNILDRHLQIITHNFNTELMRYLETNKSNVADFWKIVETHFSKNEDLFKFLLDLYQKNKITTLLFTYKWELDKKSFDDVFGGLTFQLETFKNPNETFFVEYLSYAFQPYILTYFLDSLIKNKEEWINEIVSFYFDTLDSVYLYKFRDRVREIFKDFFEKLEISEDLFFALMDKKFSKLIRLAFYEAWDLDFIVSDLIDEYWVGLRSWIALLERLKDKGRYDDFEVVYKEWSAIDLDKEFFDKTKRLRKDSEKYKSLKQKLQEDKVLFEHKKKEFEKYLKKWNKTKVESESKKVGLKKISVQAIRNFLENNGKLDISKFFADKKNEKKIKQLINLSDKDLNKIIKTDEISLDKILFFLGMLKENWRKINLKNIEALVSRKNYDLFAYVNTLLSKIHENDIEIFEKTKENIKSKINPQWANIFFTIFLKSVPYEMVFSELFPGVISKFMENNYTIDYNPLNPTVLKIIDEKTKQEIYKILA